jgi:hypothetical protein
VRADVIALEADPTDFAGFAQVRTAAGYLGKPSIRQHRRNCSVSVKRLSIGKSAATSVSTSCRMLAKYWLILPSRAKSIRALPWAMWAPIFSRPGNFL